jgi:putative transposase
MNVVVAQRPAAVPMRRACEALGVNRSSVYARQARTKTAEGARTSRKHTSQPRALTWAQREHVHGVLNNDEFAHQPPGQIYQTLLERGVCLCSVSTMHRILREHGKNGNRRDQRAPNDTRNRGWWPVRPTRYGPGIVRNYPLGPELVT